MSISRQKLLIVGAAAALVVAGIAYVILKPSEERRVRRLVRLGRDLLVRGEEERFMELISAAYSFDGLGRNEIEDMLHRALPEIRPFRAVIFRNDVRVSAGQAIALVGALTIPGSGSRLAGTDRTDWHIEFRKQQGKWKVVAIQPLTERGTPAESLGTVYRYYF